MFTIMRGAAIVALVTLGASLALTGQPGQQGPGAAGDPSQVVASPPAEIVTPTAFTGSISFGACPVEATIEGEPGVIHRRGPHHCLPVVTAPFSDPRLQGTYYVWTTNDTYLGGGPEVWYTGFTIVNDEGAWRGVPQVTFGSHSTQVLVGDGAYAGLTAIADVTLEGQTWSWDGWIIPGDVPPAPEPPAEAG